MKSINIHMKGPAETNTPPPFFSPFGRFVRMCTLLSWMFFSHSYHYYLNIFFLFLWIIVRVSLGNVCSSGYICVGRVSRIGLMTGKCSHFESMPCKMHVLKCSLLHFLLKCASLLGVLLFRVVPS